MDECVSSTANLWDKFSYDSTTDGSDLEQELPVLVIITAPETLETPDTSHIIRRYEQISEPSEEDSDNECLDLPWQIKTKTDHGVKLCSMIEQISKLKSEHRKTLRSHWDSIDELRAENQLMRQQLDSIKASQGLKYTQLQHDGDCLQKILGKDREIAMLRDELKNYKQKMSLFEPLETRKMLTQIVEAREKLANRKDDRDIFEEITSAVNSGKLKLGSFAYDLITSQIHFYNIENHVGMAVKLCYPKNISNFWFEFAVKFGESAYEFLQGRA